MTIVHSVKDRAIELRKKGLSYSEILKKIPVAKSTLSLWLRSVGLSKRQKQTLSEKKLIGMRRGWEARRAQRIARTVDISVAAIKQAKILINDPAWVVGVVLYWGEGSKEKPWRTGAKVVMTNMDVSVHQVFVKWIKKYCGVSNNDLRFDIYIHPSGDVRKARIFWAEKLKMPADIFKVYFKEHNRSPFRKNTGVDYYGVLRTHIARSTDMNRKISTWIQYVIEYVK